MIWIKGVKNEFSKDPIDFKKLRKEDRHTPKKGQFKNYKVNRYKILETDITKISSEEKNKQLLLFLHGGAFVYGPVQHHWDMAEELVKNLSCNLWMVDYPKAPEHKIDIISNNIDRVYEQALENFKPHKIILIGDSVGATLIAALVQRIIQSAKPLPAKLILISPVMEAGLQGVEVDRIDKKDPILSKAGVLSAKKMCAVNNNLLDPRLSPVRCSFHRFPETVIFIAEHDITRPGQEAAVKILKDNKVENNVIYGKSMPHIWPLLPVMKEAGDARKQVLQEIKSCFETM